MFESYEVYTKFSEKNKGEYNVPIVDKNFILVIRATRDFIDEFIVDLKFHGYDLDDIFGGLRNDSIVEVSTYDDLKDCFDNFEKNGIPADKVHATLMLYSNSQDEFDNIVSWLNYKIESSISEIGGFNY